MGRVTTGSWLRRIELRRARGRVVLQDMLMEISEMTGIRAYEARSVVLAFFEVLISHVESGDTAYFKNFGRFEPTLRKARKARNPATGGLTPVPDRVVPVFRPGKVFKERVMAATNSIIRIGEE